MRIVSLALTFGLTALVQAKPEYFAVAVQYGARDCSFCHATVIGGDTLNERGQWLADERLRREAPIVDVSWLADRDEVIEVEFAEVSSDSPQPQRTIHLGDPSRPMDYTTDHGEWPAYSGNLESHKYSPLNIVTRENVADLEVAWVWTSTLDSGPRKVNGETKTAFRAFLGTPLMVNDTVYVRTRYSTIAAIDAQTGSTLWTYDPGTIEKPAPPMMGFSTRGLSYHKGKDRNQLIYTTSTGELIALDAATGKPNPQFGEQGIVNLREGLRRPMFHESASWSNVPSVCNDVIVVGSQTNDGSHWLGLRRRADWKENLPPGDIRGFDVNTGELLWTFHTVPLSNEFGADTWGNQSNEWVGNTNVWSQMSCDTELNHVYLPVTAPSHHFYGGDRPGANLFGTSTVALDLTTGKRQWHFQIVHHDIWDYDLPAAPIVVDLVHDGKHVQAVAQVTKMAFLFVFDRHTGEPLWEVVERRVPASPLPEEQAYPTQPIPSHPPPFEPQGFTAEDVIDITPDLHARGLATIADWRHGPLYTPGSLEGTVAMPGVGGGANWGGAAFRPETQELFVASRRDLMTITAHRNSGGSGLFPYAFRFRSILVDSLPIVKPPFASITAYDLNSGNILWSVPNGPGPKDHPAFKGLDLPDLGNAGAAPGLLATPELIFLGESDPMGRSYFKALDNRNGNELWKAPIRGIFRDPPGITYLSAGEQYVVIGSGAATNPSRLTAFKLKRQ